MYATVFSILICGRQFLTFFLTFNFLFGKEVAQYDSISPPPPLLSAEGITFQDFEKWVIRKKMSAWGVLKEGWEDMFQISKFQTAMVSRLRII